MHRGIAIAAAVLVAALALAAGLYFGKTTRQSAPEISAASALTRTEFLTPEATKESLQRWQGKVVVVNFWATWCAPCREEIPGLISAQAKFAANGLQIVGIAVDSADKVKEYAQSMGVNYPLLIAGADVIDLSRRLGNKAGGLPYTVILDRQGNIVTTHLGLLSSKELERLIAPLLG